MNEDNMFDGATNDTELPPLNSIVPEDNEKLTAEEVTEYIDNATSKEELASFKNLVEVQGLEPLKPVGLDEPQEPTHKM